MSCDSNLPRYFVTEFLRGMTKVQQDGEMMVYETIVPANCNTTFQVGSSIGSQRPGLARAIVRHLYPDPYEQEERTKTRVRERLRPSDAQFEYTALAGLEIGSPNLDLAEQRLTRYSEAEDIVLDALITGLIYGMHFPDQAQRAIAQEIDRHAALEPEFKRAGLRRSARLFKNAAEWNTWTLKSVDDWQKQHGILLASQEVNAVSNERMNSVDVKTLDEEFERGGRGARDAFTKMAFRSARFRAAIMALGDQINPETWEAVRDSLSVGFFLGAGWLGEDAAVGHIGQMAKFVKRSIRSAKSAKLGRLSAFFSSPLPDDATVTRAYLAVMWTGARLGAEQNDKPQLFTRAVTELETLFAS